MYCIMELWTCVPEDYGCITLLVITRQAMYCTSNITLRLVPATVVAVENQCVTYSE